MATLDEVSMRLMRPAKDLADWNFPLATILEDYYTLLSEQSAVNFSNAALVLQNSANVYVRRVESLYHDTNSLNESFVKDRNEHEATEAMKKNDKRKHALIDFGDFETLDFTKLVGKNNNIKNRTETNDSVKLLSQRFPELENVSRSSLPIEVYDIHGEVVGKKYDFRCNEHLTESGMLVRHLTPKDFSNDCVDEREQMTTENPTIISEPAESVEEADSANCESGLCERTCDDSCVPHDKDSGLLDTSFTSSYDSGVGSSVRCSNLRSSSSLSNSPDNWTPSSRPESRLSIADDSFAMDDPSQLDNSQNDVTSCEQNVSPVEKRSREAMQDDIVDSTTVSDLQPASTLENNREPASPNSRRSKRLKNVIDDVNDLNPKLWEPIPFDGVPDELPKSRSEFKLPCPISLLKFRERPRKRKITSATRKRRCMERLSMIECDTVRNKMTMYSPTRQLFIPLKKEEPEDSQLYVGEDLKNRTNVDALSYEAVTDISMDLLGFRTQVGKPDGERIAGVKSGFQMNVQDPDSLVRGIVSSTDETTEHDETPIEFPVDNFPMPDTPESSDSSSEDETGNSAPLSARQIRIEQSIRDIYDTADVETAQERAVASWHEFLKPKLREAERRSPFDISRYTASVVQSLKSKDDRNIEFKEMVDHRESIEVARYFLATLQLANKYHVHIDTSCSVEDNFKLVLLDEDRSGQR